MISGFNAGWFHFQMQIQVPSLFLCIDKGFHSSIYPLTGFCILFFVCSAIVLVIDCCRCSDVKFPNFFFLKGPNGNMNVKIFSIYLLVSAFFFGPRVLLLRW